MLAGDQEVAPASEAMAMAMVMAMERGAVTTEKHHFSTRTPLSECRLSTPYIQELQKTQLHYVRVGADADAGASAHVPSWRRTIPIRNAHT